MHPSGLVIPAGFCLAHRYSGALSLGVHGNSLLASDILSEQSENTLRSRVDNFLFCGRKTTWQINVEMSPSFLFIYSGKRLVSNLRGRFVLPLAEQRALCLRALSKFCLEDFQLSFTLSPICLVCAFMSTHWTTGITGCLKPPGSSFIIPLSAFPVIPPFVCQVGAHCGVQARLDLMSPLLPSFPEC